MVHTGVLRLEGRLVHEEKKPSLTAVIKGFFQDKFSHAQYLHHQMEDHQFHGKFVEAADDAVQLKLYERAFTLYNQAVATGDWLANLPAAELAESRGDYERGLTYRLNAYDYGHAALDAIHLGRQEEAQGYFRRLRDGN